MSVQGVKRMHANVSACGKLAMRTIGLIIKQQWRGGGKGGKVSEKNASIWSVVQRGMATSRACYTRVLLLRVCARVVLSCTCTASSFFSINYFKKTSRPFHTRHAYLAIHQRCLACILPLVKDPKRCMKCRTAWFSLAFVDIFDRVEPKANADKTVKLCLH